MFRYSLLLFLRNLKRQKLFSAINLLGLTSSIACALLMYLYVHHELSYDRFHNQADRIYRVNQTFIWGENDQHQFASTGPGVAHAVKEELPEVELVTSIYTPGDFLISYTSPDNTVTAIEQENILAADSNFFRMFSFAVLQGEREAPLEKANTLVMTKSTALKYFGSENAVGKLVRVGAGESQQTYEVTAILDDLPKNSYIQFDVLLSIESFPQVRNMSWSWIWTQLETYVRLSEQANLAQVREKLTGIPRQHAEQTLQRIMNMTFDDYLKSGKTWELFLQPLTAIHLPDEVVYNRINNESGNIKIIYSLAGAAVFIILLACVNFMNLSTAQFTRRVKEASIRKILGVGRNTLGYNYFIEACIFSFLALAFALALVQGALPIFNLLTGKELSLNILLQPEVSIGLVLLVLFISIVSSLYPAFFLSSFHPVEAIKGKLKSGREGRSFRNGLVTFQFSLSIILILCTAIVSQQLRYVTEKDLGFDKENLLVLKSIERVPDGEVLAQEARNLPGVLNATWCTSLPPSVWGGDKFTAEGMTDMTFSLNYTSADEQFIQTLGVELLAGRNFSIDNPGDIHRVLLNETALKRIGWNADESVIGKKIGAPGWDIQFEVIGVVKDFNYWTLQAPIEPMAIFHIKNPDLPGTGNKKFVAIKIAGQSSEQWATTMEAVENLWQKHGKDNPLQYAFVDQAFADSFKTEQRFSTALSILSGFAILIACLGLLGMIVYTLEQRTKEIGIRKVSGASVWDILKLISKGYTRLITLAFFISAPFSYWLMQKWLQDFAYRVTPSVWVFVLTGLGALIVAMLITSYHSVKAALTNPVEVLKDE
jgi:putative ABC transport system permease protein